MKKKIAIFGATGSIGKNLLEIIENYNNKFDIKLLSANKNYKKVLKLAKKFKVKNVIIHDLKTFRKTKKIFLKNKISLFSSFLDYKKSKNIKFDYTMIAVTGFFGLKISLDVIKSSFNIAIANKESIICGWSLINKKLKKNHTKFIPIDSEHYSIDQLISPEKRTFIKKVYLTASGGPFLKFSKKSLDKIKIKDALNHPTWKMGQKISIDSATMINKVYEVIEAKKIFDLEYSKIDILIQPTSYVHSIIEFMNGTTHILAHKPTMKIPIFNSILKGSVYENKVDTLIDYNFINNLQLQKVPSRIFPIKKILDLIPEKDSLFETILVSANDTLVELFLTKKIPFNKIHSLLGKVLRKKEFYKYRLKKPKNINEITNLYEYVRLKTKTLSVL